MQTTISPTPPPRSTTFHTASSEGEAVEPALVHSASFYGARNQFELFVGWLEGEEAAGLSHGELEAKLEVRGRELLRQLFQDHLELRARREKRLSELVDAAGVARSSVEAGRCRRLRTVFGEVGVSRLAYRRRGHADLHPADVMVRKQPYLNYPTALERGWPIATGVIEGACRHLVKDRMDITGARWGLKGAETVLRLRALVSNCDFNEYWRYHLARELQRVHADRYASCVIPQAA